MHTVICPSGSDCTSRVFPIIFVVNVVLMKGAKFTGLGNFSSITGTALAAAFKLPCLALSCATNRTGWATVRKDLVVQASYSFSF